MAVNPPDIVAIAKAQEVLADFLLVDIDLAFTFLRIAKTAKPDHVADVVEKARKGLIAVRLFSGRIEDPVSWNVVRQRGNELEAALEAWPRPNPDDDFGGQ